MKAVNTSVMGCFIGNSSDAKQMVAGSNYGERQNFLGYISFMQCFRIDPCDFSTGSLLSVE